MGWKDDVTPLSLLRASPVRTALFVLGPVALACAHLVNSYVHDLAPLASVPFAAVMLAYAVLYARYHLAELRLHALQREMNPPSAD